MLLTQYDLSQSVDAQGSKKKGLHVERRGGNGDVGRAVPMQMIEQNKGQYVQGSSRQSNEEWHMKCMLPKWEARTV